MAAENFIRTLTTVLVHEGGFVNHPKDPGGATNQGVIQRTYDTWRRRKGQKTQSVKLMTKAERDAIYKANYWDVIRGDELPPGIDYIVFDGAVNSGPSQSVKWLQRALGPRYTGRIDGIVGDGTLSALESHPNHDQIVRAYCDRRLAFLQALTTWKTFGKGWGRRVADVRARGQAWAMGDTGPAVTYIAGAEAKANIEDAKKAPVRAVADASTGGGVVSGVVGQVIDKLTPVSNIDAVAKVIAALTILSAILFVGGLAYRWYAKRKADELADVLDLPTAPSSAPSQPGHADQVIMAVEA